MNELRSAKSEITPAAAEVLERFAKGPSVADRTAAITDLLTRKALARVVEADAFRAGVDALRTSFSSEHTPEMRLAALAQLVRIGQAAKGISKKISEIVIPMLAIELPPARLLKEADDRGYVAKACSLCKEEWVLGYAFRAIADEETGEKTRTEFIKIVFARAKSLEEVFSRLAKAVSEVRPETEAPAESIARRLTRIVAAVRTAMVSSLLPPGEDSGEAFGALARQPFFSSGLPQKEAITLPLTREFVLGVHDLVRTRFSVATDGGTYSAIRFCKRFFPRSSWPPKLRPALELVAGSILEALLLLAKQGISSKALVEHLEMTVGYRERADVLLRELADAHPEIPEQVRAWLKKERLPQSISGGEALAESSELRMDPVVGQILLDLQRVLEAQEQVGSAVVPALKLYDPSQVTSLETFLTRVGIVARGLEEVAKRRRLGLFGKPGAEIDFSVKYFEASGGVPGQRVKVIRSAVVRLNEDGTPGEVVLKGLVE